eukprot:14305888-Alexandrium_andersonii.AAC.1
MIATNESWSWANTSLMKDPLDIAAKGVRDAVRPGSFIEQFLCQELPTLKKVYSEADLKELLPSVSKALDEKLDSLRKERARLSNMHAVHTNNY